MNNVFEIVYTNIVLSRYRLARRSGDLPTYYCYLKTLSTFVGVKNIPTRSGRECVHGASRVDIHNCILPSH